ncbi:MAG: hypothetical protein NVSMB21_21640 [Vulcanimicrobiaceae bacterium]
MRRDWAPHERLPLPRFSGMLTVRPNTNRSELVLEGTYEPPLGTVGALFDSLLGARKGAHCAVRALLRRIASEREARCQAYVRDRPDIDTLNRRP